MSCSFTITLNGTAEETVRKADSAIRGAGGNFSGDSGSGEFSLSLGIGNVKGNYDIGEGRMNIRIENKPVFISCGMIESQVRKYLDKN